MGIIMVSAHASRSDNSQTFADARASRYQKSFCFVDACASRYGAPAVCLMTMRLDIVSLTFVHVNVGNPKSSKDVENK